MSRVKRYDFEKYSIFDIKDYIESLGYKTEPFRDGVRSPELHVVGTDVYIDFPEIWKDKGFPLFSHIRFETYPRTEAYEESNKLYQKLTRKFGRELEQKLKPIKDWDAIQQFVKANF